MRTVVLTCDASGAIPPVQRAALLAQAGGVSRLNLFTHGWATGSDASTEITDLLVAGLAPLLGDDELFVALHWPSDVAGDGSLLNLLELGSYFGMEARAKLIGETAGLAILRDVAAVNAGGLDVRCIGHSFGAITAAATLAKAADGAMPATVLIHDAEYVAIQGAMPNDALESGQPFGPIQRLYPRAKITTSALDFALRDWFPFVEHLECRHNSLALGFAGPSAATVDRLGDRLSVLDLTETHRQTPGFDGPSGHHGDLDHALLFDFIASA